MTRARLKKLLEKMSRTRVLVVGDLILDEFVWGAVDRISPEAPVPVVWVERESAMPGGAANVASNVKALGGKVEIVGLVGPDAAGRRLRHELAGRGMPTDGVFTDRRRPTTLKTRVVAHHQQVCRIDRERVDRISGPVLKQVVGHVLGRIPHVDGLIIEDYGKGLVHPGLLAPMVALARRRKKVVTVDPKEEHIRYYRGVTALTPNKKEAAVAAKLPITDRASLLRAGRAILRRLRPEALLLTMGEDGMMLFSGAGKKPVHIPTVAQEVFDVSGAGDTVIACFTLARAAGATFLESALLANAAAGVVVGKVGVATCSPEEITRQIFGAKRPAQDRRR